MSDTVPDHETERWHVAILVKLLLERAFDQTGTFAHSCMSAGEGLAVLLDRIGVARNDGWTVHLGHSKASAVTQVLNLSQAELPLLSDAIGVALGFVGQYGGAPQPITSPDQVVGFDLDFAASFRNLGLMDKANVPTPSFWPHLIDHGILGPGTDGWHSDVEVYLRQLAKHALATAPQEFCVVVTGQVDRPASWAGGFMTNNWRSTGWLSGAEQSRAIPNHHALLPMIVSRTLQNADGAVFVPARAG